VIEFADRWAVQGRTPEGDAATTIFDLMKDYRRVMVYPATIDTFAVLIEGSAIHILAEAAATRNACAVPAMHAIHGARLLGLRPYSAPFEPDWTNRPADAPPYLGPMELYLAIPGQEIRIVYRHEQLAKLTKILGQIVDKLVVP
jgi:hypothetical protein